MSPDNATPESKGISRRRFLVSIGGTIIGAFALPGVADEATADAGAAEVAEKVRRLLRPPIKSKLTGDRFMLLWTERTDSGVETKLWFPKTPEELAEARRFYQAARHYEEAPDAVEAKMGPVGKTVRKVQRWLAKKKPTPKERALREAVFDDPLSPALWLAYARWLENKGDPLGELMRVTWEPDTLTEGDPRIVELNRRQSELIKQHGKAWVKPLSMLGLRPRLAEQIVPQLWLTYGAIADLEIDKPGILPERAADLFDLAPMIIDLKINYEEADVPAIVRVPQLRQLYRLDLTSLELADEDLLALVASPHLPRLRQLLFSSPQFSGRAIRALASSDLLGRLLILSLTGCPLGEDAVRALAGSPRVSHLESLNLANSELDAASVRVLAASPHLTSLKRLVLRGSPVDASAVAALRDACFIRQLETLDLSTCHFKEAIAVAVARLPFESLTDLDLSSNDLGPDGVAALGEMASFPRLTRLRLRTCGLGVEAIERLVRWPASCGPEELDLRRNKLGDGGAELLAGFAGCASLRKLDLWRCEITDRGAAALAASPHLRNLRELRLDHNPIGEAGALALARSKHLNSLNLLRIDGKPLGKRGTKALVDRFGRETLGMG